MQRDESEKVVEPLIRIEDIAFARFAAPDFKAMRDFLIDFGLAVSEVGDRLYGAGGDGQLCETCNA
jgi:hypothetical protein